MEKETFFMFMSNLQPRVNESLTFFTFFQNLGHMLF